MTRTSSKQLSPGNQNLKPILLLIFFLLAAGQSIFAAVSLAQIPGETENAVWLGFSVQRLILVGGTTLAAISFLTLALKTRVDKKWQEEKISRLEDFLERKSIWGLTLLIAFAGLLGGIYFVLLGTEISEPFTKAYFVRLNPLAVWLIGFSLQTIIALPLLRFGTEISKLKPQNRITYLMAIIFGLSLLVWGLIAWTGTGLSAEEVGWNRLGTPILETQALLTWIVGIGFLGISLLVANKFPKIRSNFQSPRSKIVLDLSIALVIWVSGTILWNSISLPPSWFAAPPRPPNFEYYPNSDASLYDITAQSALVGEGFKSWGTPFAVRPAYALLLDVMHAMRGLNYEPIIILQVAVLALFPVCVYWLTKMLSNRMAGVMAATLIILREANAIVLSDEITVSHAKLLMSDLPTALGIALIALITTAWLQKPNQRRILPLFLGGVVGLFMLVRPEVGVLLAFIGLITIATLRHTRAWLVNGILIGLGAFLVISPWIWRNWQITGRIFLDSPNYRSDLIAQRYSPDPAQTEIEIQPEETADEFNQRMSDEVIEFAQEHPTGIANFVINHYFNSQIQTVLMFPTSIRAIDSAIGWLGHRSFPDFWQQCCSAEGYVRRLPFWWQWDGNLPKQSILPVAANLFILSTGLGLTWKRHKIIGLLPIVFLCAHLAINAAVRNSGGRYILPVDWAMIVYFSIGLAQVTLGLIGYFTNLKLPSFGVDYTQQIKENPQLKDRRGSLPIKAVLGVGALLLLSGWSLPMVEKAIPPRYTEGLKQEKVLSLINNSREDLDRTQVKNLEQFLDRNGSVVLGRALYPRFHKAGQGEPGSTWPSFYPRSYPRISFHLVGPHDQGVILPYEQVPEAFPHASDVLVFGCPGKDYFDALAVVVYNSAEILYFRSPVSEYSCPFSSPD